MKQKIILFLIIGLGLLSYGLYSASKQWQFYHHGITTTGVITGIAEQTGEKYKIITHPIQGKQQYHPMITFHTQNNQQITFIGEESSLSQSHFQLGEKVPVTYLPEAPQAAEIGDKFSMLSLPIVSTLLGIFLLILTKSMINRYKLQRMLKSHGQKIMADFIGFKTSKEVQNNIPGMILVCQYKFTANQPPVKFFSEPIFKKNLAIKQKRIPVYIDATDRHKYYVDTEGVYESGSEDT